MVKSKSKVAKLVQYSQTNMALTLRVTETPNELTNELDTVGAEGIVRLLRQVRQFYSWRQRGGRKKKRIISTKFACNFLFCFFL